MRMFENISEDISINPELILQAVSYFMIIRNFVVYSCEFM